jgi:hypothetical protein
MRRLAVIALVSIGIALPVCAQRGMSHSGSGGGFHGGFGGHTASASPGGFRTSAPSRPAAAPRFTGARPRSIAPANGMRSGGNYGARPDYSAANRNHRDRYRPSYRSGFAYPWAGSAGWIGPGYPGYFGDTGYDDATTDPSYAGNGADEYAGYDSQPAEQDAPPPGPYQPYYGVPRPSPAPENMEAVTLIFKDGRPSEQIHNYILSRTTLSILDQHRRDIAVDQLDIAATEKANGEAGVDFHLPSASK